MKTKGKCDSSLARDSPENLFNCMIHFGPPCFMYPPYSWEVGVNLM